MPVVLRTDPKLLTLCHLCIHALVHGCGDSSDSDSPAGHVAPPPCFSMLRLLARAGRPLWTGLALGGLLVLLVASSQPSRMFHGLVFRVHWCNRPTMRPSDRLLSPAASPQSQLVRFGCKPGFSPLFTRTRGTRVRDGTQVNPGKPGHPRTRVFPRCLCCVLRLGANPRKPPRFGPLITSLHSGSTDTNLGRPGDR